MKKEDKIHAEKVLKHLFIGAQVDGLQFGISSRLTKIHFTNFEDLVDFGGLLYLNIESKWHLYHSPPEKYPLNEEEMEAYSEEEEFSWIYQIRRQKVMEIKLDVSIPHLIITLENGCILFVNGSHNQFECWQAGVEFDDGDWLVVAVPGNEIAVWNPDNFLDDKKIADDGLSTSCYFTRLFSNLFKPK